MAGKEPEKEQKGPYTHYTFHLRKSGMAYRWRHPGSRNPHTSWEKQRGDEPVKGQLMKMSQSTPGDSGVQGRYREVLTRRGMRNAE